MVKFLYQNARNVNNIQSSTYILAIKFAIKSLSKSTLLSLKIPIPHGTVLYIVYTFFSRRFPFK